MLHIILTGLVVLLVIVLFVTYRKTKEGYEDLLKSVEESSKNAITDVGSGATQLTQTVTSAADSSVSDALASASAITSDSTTHPSPKKVEKDDSQSEIVISGPGFDAMGLQQKADLLKNIQKLIKNEAISERQTTPVAPDSSDASDSCKSDSLQQGKEFTSECKKGPCPANKDGSCPSVPDMSEYIKKDQIPCWGCTLDY
jgi:hypothetical protein